MKNQKLKTKLTLQIAGVIIVCIALLYIVASWSMENIMKKSELENMNASLNAQTNIIKQYVKGQETLLTVFSKASEVRELLKDPNNVEKQKKAQLYTEAYYSGLDNWEGLYIGEWDTHVIAHSNSSIVGMTTRHGEALKILQNAMIRKNGLYNVGIVESPATEKLTFSMYCPVFDEDGKTILGYVGGGPFAEGLQKLLDASYKGNHNSMQYSMINVKNSTYIFDINEENVAKAIQDTMLLSIIEQLQTQNEEITDSIEYEDDKVGKSIACYQYIVENGFALVEYDSEDNIYSNVRKNMLILALICILSTLLISMLSWFFINISTKPLKYVEASIMKLKNLNLEKEHQLDAYINQKSEIGQIATAIDSLYTTFQKIVLTLEQCSTSLNDSAIKMTTSSGVLLECMNEHSVVTAQFASHTEEITQAVQHVDEEMVHIAEAVYKVENKIHQGTKKSDALLEKVTGMQHTSNEVLNKISLQIKANQKEIDDALESLQLLKHIDEMADQILKITHQTNLLSLNASIEAAHAGEAGKGFGIVADEIGTLASNSSKTATAIQEICNETKLSIDKVERCFNDIITFLQKDVTTPLTSFTDATKDNYQSITEIQAIIEHIDESSKIFSDVVSSIKDRIDEVQCDPENNKVNSEEILKRVEQADRTSQDLAEIVIKNKENALAIQKIVEKFTGYKEI